MSAERRWVAVEDLPPTLRLELETGGDWALRRHPDSRPRYPFGVLIPIGAGLLTMGVLGLLFVMRPPFVFAARWIPLLVGAGVCGVWLAWRRTPEYRPARGQALVVGSASLLVVDSASVEVIPAELVERDDDEIRCGEAVVHAGALPGEVAGALDAAIASAREGGATADPWRRAVSDAGRPGRVVPSRRPLLVGGALGVAAALVLEVGVGAVREHPGQARWRLLGEHTEKLMAAIGRIERRVHERRVAALDREAREADSSFDVLPLLTEAERYRLSRDRIERLTGRYAELATAEVRAARDTGPVIRRLEVALERDLDGGFRDAARERLRELALDRAYAATTLSEIDVVPVDRAEELGLGPELVTEMVARMQEVIRAQVERARVLADVRPHWFEAIERYSLEEVGAYARGRHGELARRALASATTAGDVVPVLAAARAGHVDAPDDLSEAARARFAERARRELRRVSGRADFRPYLEIARSYELGDELIDLIYQRWKRAAMADIRAAGSAAGLERALGYWYRPAEPSLRDRLRAPIEERLSALAASAADSERVGELVEVADGVDLDVERDLIAIRDAMAHDEAISLDGLAGIEAGRRFLRSSSAAADRRSEVRDRLLRLCEERFDAVEAAPPLIAALASTLCAEPEPVLRWSTSGSVDLARRGAKLLVGELANTGDAAGVPLDLRQINVRPGSGHVAIEVEASGEWNPSPNLPNRQERPCVYRVVGADPPVPHVIEARCVRHPGGD